MFGFNDGKVAQSEIDSGGLNSRGKMESWDFGDSTRAFVYGLLGKDYSRETLERQARERQTEQFNTSDGISALNTKLTQYRPGTTITRKAGESLADMTARGNLEVGLGQAIGQAKITNPEVDFSGVTNLQELQSLVGQDNQRQTDEATKKADARLAIEDNRHEQSRQDAHNLRVMDLEGRIASERQRLLQEERSDKRNHEATMRGYDNQLASFNLENARMMQQEENRRADRKEKALYTLIASLSNLGASFSI